MSGENENASLPQLQEMADGIVDCAENCIDCCIGTYEGFRSDELKQYISTHLAPLYAELERLARYETELERAASLLQGLISIGQVKAIGLLEVASGVERLGQEKAEDIDRMRKLLGDLRPYAKHDRLCVLEQHDAEDFSICKCGLKALLTSIDAEIGGANA